MALDVSNKTVRSGGEPDVDLLLSRPYLTNAQEFYDAWEYLNADQPLFSHGAGMGGAVLLSQRLSRERIEGLGVKRGYDGDDLTDFVEIVLSIDLLQFEHSILRQSRQMAEAAKRNAPSK